MVPSPATPPPSNWNQWKESWQEHEDQHQAYARQNRNRDKGKGKGNRQSKGKGKAKGKTDKDQGMIQGTNCLNRLGLRKTILERPL